MRIKSRFIVFAFLLFCGITISQFGHAFDAEVNRSTNAVAASTTFYVKNSFPGDMMGSILINKRSGPPETLTLYDSSATANNSFGVIDLSTGAAGSVSPGFSINEYRYNVRLSSGITFSKSGGNSDVTIIWESIRAQ